MPRHVNMHSHIIPRETMNLVGANYLRWDAVDGFAMVKELRLSATDEDKILGLNAIDLFRL
jgi:hypothetical protein